MDSTIITIIVGVIAFIGGYFISNYKTIVGKAKDYEAKIKAFEEKEIAKVEATFTKVETVAKTDFEAAKNDITSNFSTIENKYQSVLSTLKRHEESLKIVADKAGVEIPSFIDQIEKDSPLLPK